MMFLQFFIWGSWYVTTGGFIETVTWADADADSLKKYTAWLTGWVYTVGPIAAIVSPLFLGVIADRFFATQIVLAALHGIGAVLMFLVPSAAGGDSPAGNTYVFLLLGYMLCYMPTLGLTATLAFHNLTNREAQFPVVRVFGTLGWIVANLVLAGLSLEKGTGQYMVAGGASALMAVYCLTLPHTSPPLKGKEVRVGELFGLDALSLFRSRSFATLLIASLLICIPLAGYYSFAEKYVVFAGFERWHESITSAVVMPFGQATEVLFMLLIPFCFARLGVKWMIAVGMLAWVARYLLFSFAADDKVLWMIFGGVLLHGICYDFFFVTGQIYVDQAAPAKIRGQAQGLLVLLTQGIGLGIGAKAIAAFAAANTTDNQRDWGTIWLYPALFAAVVLVLFVAVFKDDRTAVGAPVES